MIRYRFLMWPGYIVAALLILIPIIDTGLSAVPFHPSNVGWRFGAVGVYSRALMTPILGLWILLALAALFEHATVLRIAAIASGILGIILIGILALFALDAVQLRSSVAVQIRKGFDVSTLVAMAKYAVAAVFLLLVARVSWKAAKKFGMVQPRPAKGSIIPIVDTPAT